ncbi:MAG: hypothetical protein J0M16_06250 [Gammaproteobacteria bacterium]|nr:hypothetical protein [Gammaproteobacteria bacterium]
MYQLRQNKTGPLKMFHELFGERLSHDNFTQFFTNGVRKGTNTYLMTEIYKAPHLNDVILEEYGVREKLKGNVMLTLPEPEYNIPIFMFQLGGNETQKIALLDISPTLPDIDYSPLIPTFEKFRDLLGVPPSKLEWVNKICSPYLLHCQYDALDTETFLKATREYLKIWIEHYYLPGKLIAAEADKAYALKKIYAFKEILHDNDPAYGIFAKAWGRPVADAFFYLETQSNPALPMPA